MRTSITPRGNCPYCANEMDRASSPEDRTPRPADLTICIRCRSLLMFDERLLPRKLTAEECAQIDRDPYLVATLNAMRDALKHVSRKGAN